MLFTLLTNSSCERIVESMEFCSGVLGFADILGAADVLGVAGFWDLLKELEFSSGASVVFCVLLFSCELIKEFKRLKMPNLSKKLNLLKQKQVKI